MGTYSQHSTLFVTNELAQWVWMLYNIMLQRHKNVKNLYLLVQSISYRENGIIVNTHNSYNTSFSSQLLNESKKLECL